MKRWTVRRVAIAIAAFAITLGAALVVQGAVPADPRLDLCGGTAHGNKILAAFEMSRARDFWQHFPRALRAPELEVDSPAFVVAFDGPTRLDLWLGARSKPLEASVTRDGVVCVVVDGIPNMYSGIDFTDFRP